jgi:hypothetical protein
MHLAGARRNDRLGAGRWKKFTRGRLPWGWEALALMAPGLALFGVFAAQPEAALSNGPALLIDNLLRALAVIVAACFATVVFAKEGLASRAAFVGSAVCVLLGAAVLFAGLWSPFRDPGAMAGAALATALAALNLYRRRRVWTGIKGLSTKILIGVLTAAAVPAFNFWSETSYLPSRNAASLELSTAAAVERAPDGSDHWLVTSTITNLSPVRAFVVISGLTACRWSDESHWRRSIPPPQREEEDCERLIAPFSEGSWLDPDATLTIGTPARVDSARQLLEVRLRVAYARADRVIQVPDSERAATPQELGNCAEAEVWDLQPQSRLSALARRELQMMYAQVAEDRGRTYFFGAADSLRCGPTPEQDPNAFRFQGLNQYLSLTEATTIWAGWPDGSSPAGAAAAAD